MTEERFYLILLVAAGILFLLALLVGSFGIGGDIRRKKNARLGQRERLTPDEFYERFYAGAGLPKTLVLELLKEVADSVEVDAGLLRPSDRFSVELMDINFGRLTPLDGGLFEVNFRAELRAKKLGADLDLSRILTLHDYIKTFVELQAQRPYILRHP